MNIIFGLGMPGGWEWIIIGLIVVIFFGANKIPEIFRGFGKGIREIFKVGWNQEDKNASYITAVQDWSKAGHG